MPTRAVLFDLDETLLADSAATQDTYRATAAFASANTSDTSKTPTRPDDQDTENALRERLPMAGRVSHLTDKP